MFLGSLAVVVAGAAWLVVRPDNPPRAPETSAPPAYKPIVIDQVEVLRHGNNADIVARLQNPNPQAGIERYPVTFTVLDSQGTTVVAHTVDAYVIPGGLQYIAALGLRLGGAEPGTVEVQVPPDPVFTAVSARLALPSFNTFLSERSTVRVGDQTVEQQRGLVTNASSFNFERVEVTAVAVDNLGRAVGVGQTFLGELKVGEQREFTIQWPVPAVPTSRVVVLATTNLFREQNILRQLSDPSRLR